MSVIRPSNPSGSPSAWRSQSTTTCSSSVPLGDVRHSIGFWPSAGDEHLAEDARRPTRSTRSRRRSPGAANGSRSARRSRDSRRGSRRGSRAPPAARPAAAAATDPGSDRRQDGEPLDAGQVVGHQVDDPVGGRPERLGRHVAEPVELGRGSSSTSRRALASPIRDRPSPWLEAYPVRRMTRPRDTEGWSRGLGPQV